MGQAVPSCSHVALPHDAWARMNMLCEMHSRHEGEEETRWMDYPDRGQGRQSRTDQRAAALWSHRRWLR